MRVVLGGKRTRGEALNKRKGDRGDQPQVPQQSYLATPQQSYQGGVIGSTKTCLDTCEDRGILLNSKLILLSNNC